MRVFQEAHWLKAGVANYLRIQANKGSFHIFHSNEWKQRYIDSCTAIHVPTGSQLVFTRDTGHHTSGWWKNPDYERCLHLSLSFQDPESGEYRERDKGLTDEWVDIFFQPYTNLVWAEPPYSPIGKQRDVWHYRVFYADERFTVPILPRGEVYSKEFTEAGWLSWSDLQDKLAQEARRQDATATG